MNVTIIGDTTVGKNVGSAALEDTDNPNNKYGLLPIIVKMFNSEWYSGYDKGFVPLGSNLVRDLQLPMKKLGDVQEPLLARALELIEGSSTGGRKEQTQGEVLDPLMMSIDKKSRTNQLIIDTN